MVVLTLIDIWDPAQGLGNAVRYKAYKKRPLRSTRLTFGADFSIGVQLFATIKVCVCKVHQEIPAELPHGCDALVSGELTSKLISCHVGGRFNERCADSLVQTATKSSYTWVSAQRHEPLRSEGTEICEDTGAPVPCCGHADAPPWVL